jgi:hypothetical protein
MFGPHYLNSTKCINHYSKEIHQGQLGQSKTKNLSKKIFLDLPHAKLTALPQVNYHHKSIITTQPSETLIQ